MTKRFLYRIITFLAYPRIGESPQQLLQGASRTIQLGRKIRVFAVRKVFYDDSMTPIYTTPDHDEPRYESPQELLNANPIYAPLQDAPILDWDHSLKVYNNET
jgi:hypothetical protein